MQVVGTKKTVLIVEDEDLLGDILQEELEAKNLQIHRANGGFKALEIIRNKHIDLVITDVRMAEGDGRYVLSEIRKLPAHKPRVIVVTGLSDLQENEAKDLGAVAFIHKPFDIDEVIKIVVDSL